MLAIQVWLPPSRFTKAAWDWNTCQVKTATQEVREADVHCHTYKGMGALYRKETNRRDKWFAEAFKANGLLNFQLQNWMPRLTYCLLMGFNAHNKDTKVSVVTMDVYSYPWQTSKHATWTDRLEGNLRGNAYFSKAAGQWRLPPLSSQCVQALPKSKHLINA